MKNLYDRTKEILSTEWGSFDYPEPSLFSEIPRVGNQWLFLGHKADSWVEVTEINESIGILDTETSCFCDGGVNWVLMGTVLTHSGFYLWCHPAIVSGLEKDWKEGTLLSVGTKLKVAIAHNSAFDRSRIQESYTGQIYWIDTMSLHNAQNLFCKEQRVVLSKFADRVFKPQWQSKGSGSSLLEAYNFHVCHFLSDHKPLAEDDKKIRNLFVRSRGFDELSENYQKLCRYALLDTLYTGRLFGYVWKAWLGSTPSEYSRMGQLIHMNTIARLDKKIYQYLDKCAAKFDREINYVNNQIKTIADTLFDQWEAHIKMDLAQAKSNPAPDDWYVKDKSRIKSTIKDVHWLDKFGSENLNRWLLTLNPCLQSLNWQLIQTKDKLQPKWRTQTINCQSVNGHLLLGLKWNNQYLIYSQERGFYQSNGSDLPRPKKGDSNVVRLFSKNFFDYFKNEVVTSDNPLVTRVIELVMRTSFWIGNNSRFYQATQLVKQRADDVVMPEIVAIGTTTRRASSKIWHVLPKPSVNKLGSGFMAYITPEKEHVLLHADLDSVEAVIAALYNGLDNEFTNSVLYGVKEDSTDVHSINAKLFDIPRSAAKEFLYSSLYGSGVRGLATTLNRNNPSIPLEKCTEMATKFLTGLRGVRQDGRYVNGTASSCFNKLVDLTTKNTAGFLGNHYPYTLLSSVVGDDFFTSRANAGIQAVGRMMLDMWVTLVLQKCPWIEFYYSVHDQLIFSCPQAKIENGIQAIQQSHKQTYTELLKCLDIDRDLPNLHYVTSVIQDVKLGKSASFYGIEHFRQENY
ncbi:MAG: DNA polymerase [Waterburya sp.]